MIGNIAKVSHQVFFWLKNPDSEDDLQTLLAGLHSLTAINVIRGVHIGVPASTEKRDVIESSYQASELLFFDSVEDQNAYQTHPLHEKFIAEHQHLWRKVVVFDSITNQPVTEFGL